MIDSADIDKTRLEAAADALTNALSALERAVDPTLARLNSIENELAEAKALSEDRAQLAAKLDDALQAHADRETEFKALSQQTRAELDATIATLRDVLQGGENGEG